MWRPPHVKPEQGLGAAFIICIILSALLTIVSGQRAKKGPRGAGWGSRRARWALGLAAIVLQCIEYIKQPVRADQRRVRERVRGLDRVST